MNSATLIFVDLSKFGRTGSAFPLIITSDVTKYSGEAFSIATGADANVTRVFLGSTYRLEKASSQIDRSDDELLF